MTVRVQITTLLMISILVATASSGSASARKPNVIIIYSDDQGSIDLNCYGAKDLITPSLDALASRGVRFTQMDAPSAICSASRAGLMTGRFPYRAGVPGNVSSEQGKPGMPSDEVTMAEMLKAGGYTTGHVGKWHLGFTPDTMPNGQGFDSSFGHMGGCIDNYSHFFYWQGPNRHDLWRNGKEEWQPGQFFGDLMAREAAQFVEANRARPFFLYWAINFPHYPLQGTEKWRQQYQNLPVPRNMYAAFISTLDELVGRLLHQLDELGLRNDTLIVFQSDHGHSPEERTFFGGGNAGPYRGAKGCLFEGGLRVPSIASLPGQIPEGQQRDQFVVGCDWLPTIAEFCDVPLPKRKLDGRSIAEVLRSADAPSPHESFYWHLGSGKKAQWAVREGNWKLLGNPTDTSRKAPLTKNDELFLVDLGNDLGEIHNLAAKNPEVAQRLLILREKFLADIEQKGPKAAESEDGS